MDDKVIVRYHSFNKGIVTDTLNRSAVQQLFVHFFLSGYEVP